MSAYVAIGETGPETGVPESIDGVNPFEAPGEWLRCALHTHSTVSDGTLSPEYLVMAYEEQGFDVVAITDHWRLTQVPATERVLTIPAAELGWDIAHPHYPRQSAEFLVYGIDHIPDDPGGDRANWYTNDEENYEVRTFPDLTSGVGWAETMGAVVYVAHPYWTQLPLDDLLAQEGFAGIEVFNGSCHEETGRGDSSVWWDALLARGRRAFGIGTDDQHYPLFELGHRLDDGARRRAQPGSGADGAARRTWRTSRTARRSVTSRWSTARSRWSARRRGRCCCRVRRSSAWPSRSVAEDVARVRSCRPTTVV